MSSGEKVMEQVIEFFQRELAAIRTGRANPALVEDVKVDAYGTLTPLKQLAQISAPDGTSIVITPWDKSQVPEIEKGIREADLGIEPSNDGSVIRLALPPLTEETRQEMTKVVADKLEAARVSLRNLRHDAIKELDKEDLPPDALARQKEELTEETNRYADRLEKLAEEKKQEIMTV
jgi:ribosome recycling factor